MCSIVQKDGPERPELDTSSATVWKVFLFVAALVSSAGGKDLDNLTK